MKLLVILSGGLLASLAAMQAAAQASNNSAPSETAGTSTPAGQEQTATLALQQPVKEKKVCRSEKVTGSLTKVRRTCMTQAQWDKLAADSQKAHAETVRGAGGGANSAWNPCNSPGAC